MRQAYTSLKQAARILGLAVCLTLPNITAMAQTKGQGTERDDVKPIVADLSNHLVAITTGFAGTDVLLFGATDGPGDVVLVVRGPAHPEVIRRKEQLGGIIWANKASVTFENAPAFYHVASSREVADITTSAVLQRHQILSENLEIQTDDPVDAATVTEFRDALIRLKTKRALYSYTPGTVSLLANRLFRADLHFPANVPTGTYMVEVYLVRDGEIVSAEITPLNISKVGIGADVFHFAHENSALYGIAAILIAVFAGWLAGVAFRKK